MMPELIVYGLRAGVDADERWQEEILSTQCKCAADVAAVKAAATKDGWHSFRVMRWNGEAPDFAKAVQS